MRHVQKVGLSCGAFALALALGSGAALADKQVQKQPVKDSAQTEDEIRPERGEAQRDDKTEESDQQIGQQQCGGAEAKPYTLAPIKGGGEGRARFGAGIGPGAGAEPTTPSPVSAPVPQYWVADAALFIGNAANAAHVLRVEEGLGKEAPAVIGDHASFLLSATNRALTSLMQLQQAADATDPNVLPALRSAIGQLVAAKAMATQAVEAANAGMLGASFTGNIQASIEHLASAERAIQKVGRAYGVPQIAAAGVCSAGRAARFGAGLGGKGVTPRTPQKGVPEQPKEPTPREPAPGEVAPTPPK